MSYAFLSFYLLRLANRARKKCRLDSHPNWDTNEWSIADLFTATMGELGEAANIAKKIRRGDFTLEQARPELAKEIADVQVYLDMLADRCGIDLGEATAAKWNETSEKHGIPLRIVSYSDDCYLVGTPSE